MPVPEKLLKKVIQDNIAVVVLDGVYEAAASGYFAKYEYQPFHYQKEPLATYRAAIAMPKEFHGFKHLLDPTFRQMVESGLILNLLSKSIPPEGTNLK